MHFDNTTDELIIRLVPEDRENNAPAWEMIESGRYMPRRIRGSYRGRELG
jgi:hypothetical protein